MKTARIILPCVALAMAFPAVAQEFSGSVTLGYASSNFKDDGRTELETAVSSLAGRIAVDLGNNWSVGITAERAGTSYEGTSVYSLSYTEVNAAYAFANGAWAGLYYAGSGFSAAGDAPMAFTSYGYGIEGGYTFGAFDVAAFVGPQDVQNTYGVAAKYARDNFTVAANLTTVRQDGESLDLFGLAATYAFNDAISVFGGVTRTEFNNDDDDAGFSTIGLGASYAFTGAAVPLVASVEYKTADYSNILGDDVTSDSIRFGLTVPFGAKPSKVPQGSLADSVFNPRKVVDIYSVMPVLF